MENVSKAGKPDKLPSSKPKNGWFGKCMQVLTFGYWNKLTTRERAIWCTSWNISSWVTVGQITGGAWVWSKVTTAMPWLIPLLKSVWAQIIAFVVALRHAIDVVS